MKRIVLAVVASLFVIQLPAQSDLLVTSPVMVAEGYGNHHPQIEITNDGRANISWTDHSSESAYFAKHNGVDGFNDPVKLNPDGLGVASYSWSGPDFSIEGSNVYAVFRATNFQSYLVKSTDNGLTFGDTVRIASEPALYPFYPDVAVLNDTVYATFMNHLDDAGSSPNYVFSRSVDGGESFESFVLASDIMSEEVCDCCPPEILVNDTYVIIFFRDNVDNIRDIKAVISFDRGETFTDWISVDDHGWDINSCPSTGPDARFIDEDRIITTYKSVVDGDTKVFANIYNLATDVSEEMIDIQDAAADNVLLNYPQINIADDQVGIVWEAIGDGTSIDVFFNHSTASSISFNPENALNLTSVSGVQSKPDVAIASGIYHIVYAESTDGNLYYLQVGEPNAINEENQLQITVYPNPVQDAFLIQNAVPHEISFVTITNLQGQIIWSGNIVGSARISSQNWPKGVYFVRAENDSKSFTTKLIK